MALIIIDYTDRCYTTAAGVPVPDIVAGKFVQLRRAADEYLVFAPRDHASYHANLIELFCADRGITGRMNKEGTVCTIDSPGWNVIGGGKFERDRAAKTLKLYDNSMAYGRFESEGLRERLLSSGELAGYTVRIE